MFIEKWLKICSGNKNGICNRECENNQQCRLPNTNLKQQYTQNNNIIRTIISKIAGCDVQYITNVAKLVFQLFL